MCACVHYRSTKAKLQRYLQGNQPWLEDETDLPCLPCLVNTLGFARQSLLERLLNFGRFLMRTCTTVFAVLFLLHSIQPSSFFYAYIYYTYEVYFCIHIYILCSNPIFLQYQIFVSEISLKFCFLHILTKYRYAKNIWASTLHEYLIPKIS